MIDEQETPTASRFNRTERDHIAALEKRLAHLRDGHHGERIGNAAYPPGESYALAWVLDYIGALDEPIVDRLARIEDAQRRIFSRLGAVERWQREADAEIAEDA
jgi:hypothetical protein